MVLASVRSSTQDTPELSSAESLPVISLSISFLIRNSLASGWLSEALLLGYGELQDDPEF